MRGSSNSAVLETRLDVVVHIPEIFDNRIVRTIIGDVVARECLRTRKHGVVRNNKISNVSLKIFRCSHYQRLYQYDSTILKKDSEISEGKEKP